MTPTEDEKYKQLIDRLGFNRPTKNSYTIVGRLTSKVRTPTDTTRYREKVFEPGDKISVIGKKTDKGVSFVSSGSMEPVISSRSTDNILRKYRRAYVFQLYAVPIFCVLFAALLGYGAYI